MRTSSDLRREEKTSPRERLDRAGVTRPIPELGFDIRPAQPRAQALNLHVTVFTSLTCFHVTHLREHHKAQKIGDDGQSQDEQLSPVTPPEDLGVHVHHSSHKAFYAHKLHRAEGRRQAREKVCS